MPPRKQAPGPRPKRGVRPCSTVKTTAADTVTDTTLSKTTAQTLPVPIETEAKPAPVDVNTQNQSYSQPPIPIETKTLPESSSKETVKLIESRGEDGSREAEASSNFVERENCESERKEKKKKKVVKKLVKVMVKKIVKRKVPKVVHKVVDKEENRDGGDRNSRSSERLEFSDKMEVGGGSEGVMGDLDFGKGNVGVNDEIVGSFVSELGQVENSDFGGDLGLEGLEGFDGQMVGSVLVMERENNGKDDHVGGIAGVDVKKFDLVSKPIEIENNDVGVDLPIRGLEGFDGQVAGSVLGVEGEDNCSQKFNGSGNMETVGVSEGVEVTGSNLVMVDLDYVGVNDGKFDSLASESNGVKNADVSVDLPIGCSEGSDNLVGDSMEIDDEKVVEVGEEEKEGSLSENLKSGGGTEGVTEKDNSVSETAVEGMDVESVGIVNDEVRAVTAEESNECSDGENEEGKVKMLAEKVSNGEKSGGGIVLSGELEALERQRRRKTEIFVRGLKEDAKEEDVKKVFEQVGEVAEVRLAVNSATGKNKGFAFVRYASATDAKKALETLAKVEICGKQCTTAEVKGKDTIFLGHIDKQWKNEDLINLLQEMGIENIDTVTVIADPNNTARNRGFAFLELATYKDAHIAFKKLQNKGSLGKLKNVKVAWAEPLSQPDEEELLKVKSVYAEYLPTSWDEENVRNFFEKFGDIDTIALARNLPSSRRKDFAFINFKTREAAVACIDSFNREKSSNQGSKANIKVSLAKPIQKGKPQGAHQKVSKSASKGTAGQKLNTNPRLVNPSEAANRGVSALYNLSERTSNTGSSETSELEKRLAERALLRQMQERLGTGLTQSDYTVTLTGTKRPFSALGDSRYHSDPRTYPLTHMQSSFPVRSQSVQGGIHLGAVSTPAYYLQPQGSSYASSYSNNSNSPNNYQGRHYRL